MKEPREYAKAALENWRNDAESKISQDGVLVIASEAVTIAIADARREAIEAAVKRESLRVKAARVLYDEGWIITPHEYGCPEDDTCECETMPLLRAVLNDDATVDIDATERALATAVKP